MDQRRAETLKTTPLCSFIRGAGGGRGACRMYPLAPVLLSLPLLIAGPGACASSSSPGDSSTTASSDGDSASSYGIGGRGCFPPVLSARVRIGCVPREPPVLTGPCILGSGESKETVVLTATGAGTCHVEVTFGTGARSSIDVNFIAEWRPFGDDPHGCGQAFWALNDAGSVCGAYCEFALPEGVCDAGT